MYPRETRFLRFSLRCRPRSICICWLALWTILGCLRWAGATTVVEVIVHCLPTKIAAPMTISEVAKGIVVESYDGSKERMGSPRLRRTRGATALTTTTKTTVDPQRWWGHSRTRGIRVCDSTTCTRRSAAPKRGRLVWSCHIRRACNVRFRHTGKANCFERQISNKCSQAMHIDKTLQTLRKLKLHPK